jgi:hypothetical protein
VLLETSSSQAASTTRSYVITTAPGPSRPPPLSGGAHHPGLEECTAVSSTCAVVYPTGTIELTRDDMAGAASIALTKFSVAPLSMSGGILTGQPAIDLFLALDGATGTLVPSVWLLTIWSFDLGSGVQVTVADLFGQSIKIDGGRDLRWVGRDSAWINLQVMVVPEPSAAVLMLVVLGMLSAGRSYDRRG